MRKVVVVPFVAGALALGLLVPRGSSAPAPAADTAKWEYGEVSLAEVSVVPTMPTKAGQKTMKVTVVRWSTAGDEVDGPAWPALADKLGAPPAKKDSSTAHKLRVFNRLSELGWEMQASDGANNSWTFRRRVH
jgi:hypothetical protein